MLNRNEAVENSFIRQKQGMPFYTEESTGFVDVRDIVNTLVLLMESDAVNRCFILNSENLSFKTFYIVMAEALNRMKPFIKASHFMTETGWR